MKKPDHKFLTRQNSLNKIKFISQKLNSSRHQKEKLKKGFEDILKPKPNKNE